MPYEIKKIGRLGVPDISSSRDNSRAISTPSSSLRSSLESSLSFLPPISEDSSEAVILNDNSFHNDNKVLKRVSSEDSSVMSVSTDGDVSELSGMSQFQRESSLSKRRIQLIMKLEEHMFEPESVLGKKDAQALLFDSSFHPKVLIGWKVTLLIT
jgi:hypothetical protein